MAVTRNIVVAVLWRLYADRETVLGICRTMEELILSYLCLFSQNAENHHVL